MPIQITCQCGGKFAVNRRARGKKAKCPECGKVLRVPGGESASQPPASGVFLLKCVCGAKLKIKKSAITSALKCPACGEPIKIKLPEQKVAPPAGAEQKPKEKGEPCPVCQQAVEPGAGVCVSCGTNVKIGQQLQTLDPVTVEARKKRAGQILTAAGVVIVIVLFVIYMGK